MVTMTTTSFPAYSGSMEIGSNHSNLWKLAWHHEFVAWESTFIFCIEICLRLLFPSLCQEGDLNLEWLLLFLLSSVFVLPEDLKSTTTISNNIGSTRNMNVCLLVNLVPEEPNITSCHIFPWKHCKDNTSTRPCIHLVLNSTFATLLAALR